MAALGIRLRYGGKVYTLYDAFPTKALAINYAKDFEEQGLGDAIVKYGGPSSGRLAYGLYVHETRRNPISKKKARTILHHGKVRGKTLTEAQRRFMGARASGYPVKKNPDGKLVLSIPGIGDFVHDHKKAMKGTKKNPRGIQKTGGPFLYLSQTWKGRRIHLGAVLLSDLPQIKKEFVITFLGRDSYGNEEWHILAPKKKTKKNPPLMVIGNPPEGGYDIVERRGSTIHKVDYRSGRESAIQRLRELQKLWKAVGASEELSMGIRYRDGTLEWFSFPDNSNPPDGDLMSDSVHEVRYTHRGDGQPYKHSFKKGVRMVANEDGTITMYHPTKRIHEEFPE